MEKEMKNNYFFLYVKERNDKIRNLFNRYPQIADHNL